MGTGYTDCIRGSVTLSWQRNTHVIGAAFTGAGSATLEARTEVRDLRARCKELAFVAVGDAVTAAHRRKDLRTDVRQRHAVTSKVGRITHAGRQFADLPGTAGQARYATAYRFALTGVQLVYSGGHALAVVSIGLAVTAAHGVPLIRTELRNLDTDARCRGVPTDSRTLLAEAADAAADLPIGSAAYLATSTRVIETHARRQPLTVVAVGHTVTAADGSVVFVAVLRDRNAYPLAGRAIAVAGQSFADRALGAEPGGASVAEGHTWSRMKKADPRLHANAVVFVGLAVAAANGIDDFRANAWGFEADTHGCGIVTVTGPRFTEQIGITRGRRATATGLGVVSRAALKSSHQRIDGLGDHAEQAVDQTVL